MSPRPSRRKLSPRNPLASLGPTAEFGVHHVVRSLETPVAGVRRQKIEHAFDALYRLGRIKAGEWQAVETYRDDYATAAGATGSERPMERLDSSGQGGGTDRMLDAVARLRRAQRTLGPARTALLQAAAIECRSLSALFKSGVRPSSRQIELLKIELSESAQTLEKHYENKGLAKRRKDRP